MPFGCMESEIEREIKLTLADGNSAEIMDKALKDPFVAGGNVFISEHYTDFYYDTPDGFLYSSSGSLRVREFNDGKRRFTFKSFVSDEDGILTRKESEGTIVESDEETIRKIVNKIHPGYEGEMNHVLTLETHRWMMSTSLYYIVCIDNCRYIDPADKNKVLPFVEVEIESMREPIEYSDDMRNFISTMESSFGMTVVTDSKYKRGYTAIRG